MDPDQVNPQPEFVGVRSKGKDLTVRQRRDVLSRLLWEVKDHGPTMKFPRGVLTTVASEFRVSHNTIRRVWKCAVENLNDLDVKQFCASPQKTTIADVLKSGIVMRFGRLSKQCPAIKDKPSAA